MNGTMGRRRGALLGAAGLAAITLGVIALGACAKKITQVDSNYTTPEGRATSMAHMIVWHEDEVEVEIWGDAPPAGPFREQNCNRILPGASVPDSLITTAVYRRAPASSVVGMIIDGTAAGEYQILRREEGGGFRPFQDFTIFPLRRWLPQQWEVYRFTDSSPSRFQPATYLGRGLVGGRVTQDVPLTNPGMPQNTPIGDIAYTGLCNPSDSLFRMTWSAVPGALRYWIHVYRFSQPPSAEGLLASSLPGPVVDILPGDVLVAYVDTTHDAGGGVVPPATDYKLGDHARSDVAILAERGMTYGEYLVRITAVDSLGRILAYTRGDYNLLPGESGTYLLFKRGAAVVTSSRPETGLLSARPEAAGRRFRIPKFRAR
jgi:hypothetical protein